MKKLLTICTLSLFIATNVLAVQKTPTAQSKTIKKTTVETITLDLGNVNNISKQELKKKTDVLKEVVSNFNAKSDCKVDVKASMDHKDFKNFSIQFAITGKKNEVLKEIDKLPTTLEELFREFKKSK